MPGGRADAAMQQAMDNGQVELRNEHDVRQIDMGTVQKQRMSHDKPPREQQETQSG